MADPYKTYWRRKQLITGGIPHFSVKRWWPSDGLSEIEHLYFDRIKGCRSLLDFGAGNLSVRDKFVAAGFTGEYQTLDVGSEYAHSYRNLSEVNRRFDAILCLDVIEHLELGDGLSLIENLVALLEPGGVFILQTPNARCIRHPLSWDMTHLHCYNAVDLWAFLRCLELDVAIHRVVFSRESVSPFQRIRSAINRYFIARVLGCDYADNLAVIARRRANN